MPSRAGKRLTRISREMNDFGGIEFYRAIGETFKRAKAQGRYHLTFDEWDELFELAVEEGAAVMIRSEGVSEPKFRSPLGFALLRLWRGIGDARANGESAWQFWQRWDNEIDSAQLRTKAAAEDHAQHVTAIREEQRHARGGKGRSDSGKVRKPRVVQTIEGDDLWADSEDLLNV